MTLVLPIHSWSAVKGTVTFPSSLNRWLLADSSDSELHLPVQQRPTRATKNTQFGLRYHILNADSRILSPEMMRRMVRLKVPRDSVISKHTNGGGIRIDAVSEGTVL